MATNANTFSNIFKNYPGIESEDPDEIIEFAQMRYEAEKSTGKNKSFTGADPEKLRRAGIQVADRSAQFNKVR